MTPAEKRKQTILKRYGSFKAALHKRDVRDLILGGYNGGITKTDKDKGFASWEEEDLKQYTAKRGRDSNGRFLPKETTETKAPPTDKPTDR